MNYAMVKRESHRRCDWWHIRRYPKLCRRLETRSSADYAMMSSKSGWWQLSWLFLIYSCASWGGKWDRWTRAVPHPNFGAISSDIGYCDVFVAQ